MKNQAKVDFALTHAKSERNRSDYCRTKKTQEPVLLRLGVGEKRGLDQAAFNTGLSRSAFAQLYLIPICAALTSERLGALDQIMRARGIGLSTLVATLLDNATAEISGLRTASEDLSLISEAFDTLFPTDESLSAEAKTTPS